MLNRQSPIPLYHQLAELLLGQIRNEEHSEGEKLPSENELAALYGVGRPTVRQAIDHLARKGVVERKRGAGTFVARRKKALDLFSLAGASAAFHKEGISPQVKLASPVTLGPAPKSDDNPFSGQEAYTFSRLSSVDGAPVLLERLYLHPTLFSGLQSIDLAGQSLSRIVEERFHLQLTGGEQHFRIAYPDEEQAALLALSRETPILAVNRYLHFPDAINAIYSELFCRTDRFVFTQTIGGAPHA